MQVQLLPPRPISRSWSTACASETRTPGRPARTTAPYRRCRAHRLRCRRDGRSTPVSAHLAADAEKSEPFAEARSRPPKRRDLDVAHVPRAGAGQSGALGSPSAAIIAATPPPRTQPRQRTLGRRACSAPHSHGSAPRRPAFRRRITRSVSSCRLASSSADSAWNSGHSVRSWKVRGARTRTVVCR